MGRKGAACCAPTWVITNVAVFVGAGLPRPYSCNGNHWRYGRIRDLRLHVDY